MQFYSKQARYKQLVAAKEGKYRMVAKSRESRETEEERQLQKLRSLQTVVEKLLSDFPDTHDQLNTVAAALTARLARQEEQIMTEVEAA